MLPDPLTSNPNVASSNLAGRTTPAPVLRTAPNAPRTWERYVRITVDGERVYLHRHVMEQKLGRRLTWDDVVHHIDQNKKNNRPENLALTDHSRHASEHHRKPPILRTCPECGDVFNVRGRLLRQRFCSTRCGWNAKRAGFQMATKPCAQCDLTFLPNACSWPQWHRTRFCSIRCAATYRWTNRQGIGSAKLTRETAQEIRRLRAEGASVKSLGRRFGVHSTNISHIVAGDHWR